jgi:hypothetical protein
LAEVDIPAQTPARQHKRSLGRREGQRMIDQVPTAGTCSPLKLAELGRLMLMVQKFNAALQGKVMDPARKEIKTPPIPSIPSRFVQPHVPIGIRSNKHYNLIASLRG